MLKNTWASMWINSILKSINIQKHYWFTTVRIYLPYDFIFIKKYLYTSVGLIFPERHFPRKQKEKKKTNRSEGSKLRWGQADR